MLETLRPDPTFHPSPRLAMEAEAEHIAYTVLLSPDRSRPDALAVVDVDPKSKTYGSVLNRLDMPNRGDEFHHFGWNACSSALSPMSGHAFLQRRYLIIPGIRSSRIYVVDTQPDPRAPKIIKTIEPEEVLRKTGYSRPHTVHCGPEGIYVSTLGGAGADGTQGPPGVFIMDCETFEILGRWEIDRGPQKLHYDFWWNLPRDYMVSSEWGLPPQFENGIVAGRPARQPVRPRAAFLGPARAQARADHRPRREPPDGARDPPGARPDARIRFPRRGGRHHQSGRVDLDLVPRKRRVPHRQDRDHPARAGRRGQAARAVEGLRCGAAADQRHRPVAGRSLPLRGVLGHRRIAAVRRDRPDEAGTGRQRARRRHRAACAAPERPAVRRRPADDRDQPRRQARLLHQLAVQHVGHAVLSRRRARRRR